MTAPALTALYATMDATWPAAATHREGPWLLREGQDGGKRVSAATATGPVREADIPLAEAGMAALGQPALFQIREGDAALDGWLAARGYGVVDPVVIYLAPVAALAGEIPPVTAFPIWPPLQIERDIWAEGGIGAGRQAVMARAPAPKTAILARRADKPAGVAFVAIHDRIAMLHALEVPPARRRQKAAHYILRCAANWAQDEGAAWISLVVTEGNAGARALYASLSMAIVGKYHYRLKAA